MIRTRVNHAIAVILCTVGATQVDSAELLVGGASVSITPKLPVALTGQMRTRIARSVESEVIATALALETKGDNQSIDQAIFVSCDLVAIREGIAEKVRASLKDQIPDFDAGKLVLNATHTHTAPVMIEGKYELPAEGVMKPAEYVEFLCDRVAGAAVTAWKRRKPGRVAWGLGHAVVTQNRRSVYAGGRAQMYGRTGAADFRGFEGYEDHGVEVLFFWDADEKLTATAINVACPSQEVEGRSAVNADFWHEVRLALRRRFGDEFRVLAWTGAAGDQSPHLMYRKRAEERMRELRGLTRLQELSSRIVQAWDEAYAGARQDIRRDVLFTHNVKQIELPVRPVTDKEFAHAKSQVEVLSKDPKNRWRVRWEQAVVDRYEQQQTGDVAPYKMELHVIRLGDVAIATNDFELFTDFGIQMKTRSKALQTFIVQLAGAGSYVPTRKAVDGGGYSAIVESSVVGPQGGQVLVERTVEAINKLWDESR
ncbi:MAG: hypothetical protein CMJ64_07730 [Planctomycetaceae bacterium]|nr:hypothetical protein [Planctomycetaceae bacterium]